MQPFVAINIFSGVFAGQLVAELHETFTLGTCGTGVNQTLDNFGCQPILEADSICDLINNRAQCQFDGGDCNGDTSNDTSKYDWILKKS